MRFQPTGASQALVAFRRWLANNPADGDQSYDRLSAGYQVARYCEYLDANPWPFGDPLRDEQQRKGVVDAYAAYLGTFNTPADAIEVVKRNLDRFYLFLGAGSR